MKDPTHIILIAKVTKSGSIFGRTYEGTRDIPELRIQLERNYNTEGGVDHYLRPLSQPTSTDFEYECVDDMIKKVPIRHPHGSKITVLVYRGAGQWLPIPL